MNLAYFISVLFDSLERHSSCQFLNFGLLFVILVTFGGPRARLKDLQKVVRVSPEGHDGSLSASGACHRRSQRVLEAT